MRPAVLGRTGPFGALWQAYRHRLKRRRLLLRALRKRRDLTARADRTAQIAPQDILLFCTCRNEALRLPWFLDHYRRLGVAHFLFVDNASTDGTAELLQAQPDVSLWSTSASYKRARFGMDWLNGLLLRYGHGHWTLTVDADELLIYPHWETRPLLALTDWLDSQEIPAFGTLMLDLYPKGPVGDAPYRAGQDPTEVLGWFDKGNYTYRPQQRLQNLWIQGGPRARAFFASQPKRAPTLGKVPLVKWHWRYAYLSSTHSLLPARLNARHVTEGAEPPSGILLHTKFLETIVTKSHEEKERRQHFANSSLYEGYYDALISSPDLWCAGSTPLRGWRQLEAIGLMSRGGWV